MRISTRFSSSATTLIGDDCKLQITVRSFTPDVRQQLIDAIRRKAKAQCDSSGAPAPEIEVSDGTPALWNDPKLADRILPAIGKAIGVDNVEVAEPSMGGEDFGAFGRAGVPIVMMSVGSVDPKRLAEYRKEGAEPSLHSPRYYPEIEPTITTGVTALATAAMELLPPEKK